MLLTLLKIWAVALALLCYGGWGLARWLTPPVLRPVRPLLVPFFGYALVAITLYYLLWLGIAIDTGRWILLALASVLNVLGWWFTRHRPPVRLRWDELGLAGGVALLGGIVAVLPVLTHGILAPMGASWDVEFYLPLAAYLRHWPYAHLGDAPPNPLVGIIQSDPTYARAIGFSYLQGLVDSFRNWDALRTFAPLLGLMRLLAAPAVFLFARYGLRQGKWAATLAASLVALNELLLWVEYAGFAMHVSSMPLIPFTLLLTILALQELHWPTTGGAAFMLAALAASYHPGLLGYGALAGGAGLWYLLRSRERVKLLLHGSALLLGAAALTFLVQLRANRAFFQVYEQGASALGTPGYISLRTLLGLTPLAAAEAPAPPPWGPQVVAVWPIVITLAFMLMLILAVVWLWRGRGARGLALTMLGMAGLYALGLRYVVAFPYGHMKGLSFISFLPLTLVAGGCELLIARGRLRSLRWATTGLATALILLVVTATAWNSYTRVANNPTLYGREQLRLLELASVVPPGAPVLLSGSEELRGTTTGLAAYALRDHPIIGRTATGYMVYDQLPPGSAAPYALLAPHDDPTAWGLEQSPIWQSPVADLYVAPPARLAHLSGQSVAAAYPTALHTPTSLQLAEINQGPYRLLDRPLDLHAGTDTLAWETVRPGAAVSRTLVLALGSPTSGHLQIRGGGLDQRLPVTAGVTELAIPPFTAPATLHLTSDQPLVVRWAELYAQQPTLPTPPKTLFVQATTTVQPHGADLKIAPGPTAERLRLALEIYEDAGYPRHYGAAIFDLKPQQLTIDLANHTATAGGKPLPFQWEPRRAGRYWAALWVYQGQTLLQRLPLFRFTDDGKTVNTVEQLPANAAFIALPSPDVLQDGQFGTAAGVTGTTWTPASPGKRAQLSVWWQTMGPTSPLLVTAQLLDATNHKWAQWDGVLGGDAAPSTTWSQHQTVRQDIPLQIDPHTLPGQYRLILRTYHPENGQPIPFTGIATSSAGADLILSALVKN